MSKIMKTSWILTCALSTALVLALSACGSKAPKRTEEPQISAGEEAQEQLAEPKSIIRPDAEIDRDAVPLEPISLRIPFDEGQPELTAEAIEALKAALESRQMKAGGVIVLRGHTDSKGTDSANLRVSRQRAGKVRDWLVDQKIAPGRILVIGLGEQNPERPNANPDGTPNEENRAYNRRVMLDIAPPADLAASDTEQVQTLVEQVAKDN